MKSFDGLKCTDALGRQSAECEGRRGGRYVGMFYFLWCGADKGWRHKPYDISKITSADPDAGYKPSSEVWGGIGTMHYWGEPFYGYYFSEDEWVIRKHMKLLMQADIDFLFFDVTNGPIYEENAKKVMRVLEEYHNEGFKIPKVMFYTNSASGDTVQRIYDAIYKPEYCKDTWFYYEGRPLIIAKREECSEECVSFFNIKKSQWPNEPDKIGGWPWMDFTRPQRVFKNEDGVDEVINVSVAQHPQLRFGDSVLYGEDGNCGRAYHNGHNDPDKDAYLYGYNFAEQFERAIEADVPVVLVTGWNEWIAGRWEGIPERPIMFVDCANYEYSRDIEMMRGGYFDNYFCQLVSFVRRYKGCEKTPLHKEGQTAVFYNTSDGTFERDCDGAGTHYVNKTGVNSIASITVSHGDGKLFVTVKTNNDAVKHSGQTLGLMLEMSGQSRMYDINSPECTRFDKSGAAYEIPLGEAVKNGEFTALIKCCDGTKKYERVEDFYDVGDVCPLGRFNFVYKGITE